MGRLGSNWLRAMTEPDSQQRVLVTGASGFVGRALTHALQTSGYNVLGAVRQLQGRVGKDSTEINRLEVNAVGNISNQTQWSSVLQGMDTIVHCAARVHVMREEASDPLASFREVNVAGTLHLAKQAVAAGVQRFIFLSSIGVNGVQTAPGKSFSEADKPAPHSAYAQSKWEAEEGLLNIAYETGLKVVIVRPPLVYGFGAPGNFASLIHAVQRGWPLPLGAVHNQRSFIALDNLVDFIVTCITHPQAANQIFLVSDGHDLSTPELVCGMAQAAGVPVRMLPVPVWVMQAVASLLGKGDAVQRLCGNLQVDISKAQSMLGWVPNLTVMEGLRLAMGDRSRHHLGNR